MCDRHAFNCDTIRCGQMCHVAHFNCIRVFGFYVIQNWLLKIFVGKLIDHLSFKHFSFDENSIRYFKIP